MMLRVYIWFYSQASSLTGLKGPYGVAGNELRLVVTSFPYLLCYLSGPQYCFSDQKKKKNVPYCIKRKNKWHVGWKDVKYYHPQY